MKTPILSSPPFPNFNQTTPCSFCCLVSLMECLIAADLMCYFLLNDLMYLHMLSLSTPVLEGPFSLLNAARCQLTEVLCYYSDLISHTQTKTCNTHGGSRLTHQYTNIDIY